MKNIFGIATALLLAFGAIAQEACVGGFSGDYPCSNVDRMGFISINDMGGSGPHGINDIWGWTDPNTGVEYALVGKDLGLAIVDISDPISPLYIGTLPTHTDTSLWRDVKVIGNYAFVGSEAQGHGIQIFDLTQLAEVTSPPVIFSETAHYDGIGKSHNVVANAETGFIYAVGSNTFEGGPHFIDMNDPLNPTIAGGFSDQGYCHDAQVVIYHGPDEPYQGKEIYFGCHGNNAEAFNIVDVSDKSDPILIKAMMYPDQVYTHQGWLTQDHKFFLLNDELDEQQLGYNTRTRIFNVEDLDAPVFVGHYESSIPVIDHNLYTRGNFAFLSNYTGGLRILDLTDIANGNLTEIGYYDVHPWDDGVSFAGTWSNYPYFASGNIVVTHRTDGLFIVRPTSIDITTSLDEIKQIALDIYPNPATQSISIQTKDFTPLNSYKILDISGKLILSGSLSSVLKVDVDVSELAIGSYYVKVNGGAFATIFIKQ